MADDEGSVLKLAAPIEPDPTLVALLEDYLARAKEGELRSVAICGHLTGARVCSGYGGENYAMLLGSIEILKARILRVFE
jgi:hypothetical protein